MTSEPVPVACIEADDRTDIVSGVPYVPMRSPASLTPRMSVGTVTYSDYGESVKSKKRNKAEEGTWIDVFVVHAKKSSGKNTHQKTCIQKYPQQVI